MKIGDKVVITKEDMGFFEVGETAALTLKDDDGYWWGEFSNGRRWCITENGECEPINSKPTIADSAIYQQTAQLAEKYKAQRDELLAELETIATCYESGQQSVGSRSSQAYDMRCIARQAIVDYANNESAPDANLVEWRKL